jgi:hypothetical protein
MVTKRRDGNRGAPWTVSGVDFQQVKILPGIWVAPAGSYRSGGGGNKTVGAFETSVSLEAMQRADRP